jgi:hypothetical protein
MSSIVENLPFELANIVYSYLGKHPIAKIIEEAEELATTEFCNNCSVYLADKDANGFLKYDGGLCEYCHAEELGVDVFSCYECNEKTYDWLTFRNCEKGLYCPSCYDNLEDDEAEEYEIGFCVGCEEEASIKGWHMGGEDGVNLCVNCWS